MISGGLDSAVLLYLLYANGLYNLPVFTIDKLDGSLDHANAVVNHFNSKFNLNLPRPIIVGDPSVHHRLQSTTAVIDIFTNHGVDVIYNALNKNPEELNNLPSAPKRTTTQPPKMILPFINLYKTHIIDLMYEFEQEDLLDITHSCTERSVGRCDICWQCQERAWAFTKLNKKDTGKQ